MKAKPKNSRSGFSLIEIMVVVVIISILVGVVAVSVMNQPDEAAAIATSGSMKNIETALMLYKNKHRTYPTTRQGLEALIKKPTAAPIPEGNYPSGGYLQTSRIPEDGWGNPFIFLAPGKNGEAYELISYGADGEPGGEEANADISSSDD